MKLWTLILVFSLCSASAFSQTDDEELEQSSTEDGYEQIWPNSTDEEQQTDDEQENDSIYNYEEEPPSYPSMYNEEVESNLKKLEGEDMIGDQKSTESSKNNVKFKLAQEQKKQKEEKKKKASSRRAIKK